MKRSNRIYIFTPYFYPSKKAGGPVVSLLNLCRAICRSCDLRVITRSRDADGSALEFKGVDILISDEPWKTSYISRLDCLGKSLTVPLLSTVYFNSLFAFWFSLIPLFCFFLRGFKGSIIVAPRGELAAERLVIRGFKKKVVLLLYKLLLLRVNIAFHATSSSELESVSKCFPGCKVFLIPNISTIPSTMARSARDYHLKSIIFVGRIAQEKGALFALECWRKFQLRYPDSGFTLDFYGALGPDKEYNSKFLMMIKEVPGCNYNGVYSNEQLHHVYSCSYLMISPTLGENFGHSIFEAITFGVNVLVSGLTMYDKLSEYSLGSNIDSFDVDQWCHELHRFISLYHSSAVVRRPDYLRRIDYLESIFNQSNIAQKYLNMFSYPPTRYKSFINQNQIAI